ncbi:hypothetical protein [Streptomyces sp. SPB162]|uniref:hypothetical protein n=1 Tax=Streptomyces sp. SPB162 TaxID=2940560 RepID=UPI002A57806F|nr:hypothetical protein [Streptomyces sp. SPB162]
MLTTAPTGPDSPDYGYGLAMMSPRLPCGVTVWGHDGGIFGSSSGAVTTRDGRHSLSTNTNTNTNADWIGGQDLSVPAEFCPTASAPSPGSTSPTTAFPTTAARTLGF